MNQIDTLEDAVTAHTRARERRFEGFVAAMIDDFLAFHKQRSVQAWRLHGVVLEYPDWTECFEWIESNRRAGLLDWLINNDPQCFALAFQSLNGEALARHAFYHQKAEVTRTVIEGILWKQVTEEDYDLRAYVEDICKQRGILGSNADAEDERRMDAEDRARNMQRAM